MRGLIVLLVCNLLAGCVSGYRLVQPASIPVAQGSITVTPSIAWNRIPTGALDIAREESWTQNGQALDSITFIGGLPSGEAIARQQPKEYRKVPVFRASMTSQDLLSMVDSYYRIKVGAALFVTTDVAPATFLGKQAMQVSYDYILADGVKRRGRMLLAVANDKLYAMSVVGTALHYFGAALPQFESLAASASIS